jgi:prevent-host-death family protein
MAHPLRVSEDFIPISEFTAQAGKLLARPRQTGRPIVILQRGRAAAVLVSPAEYDRLTERERFTGEVKAGHADLDAGRSYTTDEVRLRLGIPAKKKRSR